MPIIYKNPFPEKYLNNEKVIPYDDFINILFSDDGYDEAGITYVDINALTNVPNTDYTASGLFTILKDLQLDDTGENQFRWFSADGTAPDWYGEFQEDYSVENWAPDEGDAMYTYGENNSPNVEPEPIPEPVSDPELTNQMEDQDQTEYNEESQVQTETTSNQESDQNDNQNNADYIQGTSTQHHTDPNEREELQNLINSAANPEAGEAGENKDTRIVVFGSSKGGTGKTFTTLMSTYQYARAHPEKSIALVDFDITDGQVGISIHKFSPTMANYYKDYLNGENDFETLYQYRSKSDEFPSNIDFYLAPISGQEIENDEFWENMIENLIGHYDLLVFDTGIDYLNKRPIALAYKSADKINLLSTTSIKSTASVLKQISNLIGETPNDMYDKDDQIQPRINVILTQCSELNSTDDIVENEFRKRVPIIAKFGTINANVYEAEFYGRWDVFNNDQEAVKTFLNIMS